MKRAVPKTTPTSRRSLGSRCPSKSQACSAVGERSFAEITPGLQNNLHRWHDPTPGLWLNEDPIGDEGSDENLHKYVGRQDG